MDVGRILDVTQDAGMAGLGLTWVIVQGILLWSLVGVVLGLGLYFAVARLGWLDARGGQRRRWARVVFAVALLLVFAPAAGGVGLATQVRNKVGALMLEQLAEKGASQAIGGLLLLPTMISHDLLNQLGPKRQCASRPTSAPASSAAARSAQAGKRALGKRVRSLLGRMASRFVGEEKKPERTGPDVTFLLTIERRGLVGTLAGGAARQALHEAPVYLELRKQSAVAGLVADLAVDFVSRQADKKIAIYTDLFAGLRAGEDGKLFHSEAARHVGQRFFERTFIPYVKAPFDALRIKLLLLALLWPLLVLGGIRLGLRRGGGPPPPAESVPSDG